MNQKSSLHGASVHLIALASFLLFCVSASAADRIVSAKDAVEQFQRAYDQQIKPAVSTEIMKEIDDFRKGSSPGVSQLSKADLSRFQDPKYLPRKHCPVLFGSRDLILHSSGEVWKLAYGPMTELDVYLDGVSDTVLCILIIPEG